MPNEHRDEQIEERDEQLEDRDELEGRDEQLEERGEQQEENDEPRPSNLSLLGDQAWKVLRESVLDRDVKI